MELDKYFHKPHTAFGLGNNYDPKTNFMEHIDDVNNWAYDNWQTIRLNSPISKVDAENAWNNLKQLKNYYIDRGNQIIRFCIHGIKYKPPPGHANIWYYRLDITNR